MSFTINSVVFKVFLPVLVGLAIFATLDSVKVESLDPQVDSLDDAISSFDREIVLAKQDENGNYNQDKARGKLREAVIMNVMISQHCGLTLKPEEAEVIRDQGEFSSGLLETIKNIADPDSSESGSAKIFLPTDYQGKEPYEILRGDDVGITCAGADQLSSNIPGASAITENEGNDMEGRYGRIGFEVDGNFTVEDTRAAGFSFPDLGEEDSEGVYTNLLTGRDILTFAPEGCGDSEFYDSKVKMENVPLIVNGENTGDLCDETALAFNEVEFDYLMCEGSEGYIQTNVGGQSGENTLGGKDKIGAYYFNYLGSVDDVSESVLPFPVPDIFSDTSSDVRGFIQDQVVDVDLNPKIVVTSGEDNCITGENRGKDIVVDDSQVIGPAIDLGSDGSRERCEFDSLESFGEVSREWNGLNVKCGLKEANQQEGSKYYRPVWYVEDEKVCLDDAEVHDSYRRLSGSQERINFDENGIIMEKEAGQDRNDVVYNLGYVDGISKIDVEYENMRSTVTVSVNGDRPAFRSGEAHNEIYFEQILMGESSNIDVQYEAENTNEAPQSGYSLSLIPSDSSVDWRWQDSGQGKQYFETIDSLPEDIDSLEFRHAGGDNSQMEIKSVRLSGGAAC